MAYEWTGTNHGWHWRIPGRPGYRGVAYHQEDADLFRRSAEALMRLAEHAARLSRRDPATCEECPARTESWGDDPDGCARRLLEWARRGE